MERAAALALVHDDDETNIRAALTARRLNPRLRLVIRLYNRKLGLHLEELLDQAAALASPGLDPAVLDAATPCSRTPTPPLPPWPPPPSRAPARSSRRRAAAARRRTHPARRRRGRRPRTLHARAALSTTSNPAGAEGSDRGGAEAPRLLPTTAESPKPPAGAPSCSKRSPTRVRRRRPAGSRAAACRSPSSSPAACGGRSPASRPPCSVSRSRPGSPPTNPRCTPPTSPCSTSSRSTTPRSTRRSSVRSSSSSQDSPGCCCSPCSSPPCSRPSAPCAAPPDCAARRAASPAMSCCSVSARSAHAYWPGCANSTSPWCAWRRTPRRAASRSPAACAYRP